MLDILPMGAAIVCAAAGGALATAGYYENVRAKLRAALAVERTEVAFLRNALEAKNKSHAMELQKVLDAREQWIRLHDRTATAAAKRQQEVTALQKNVAHIDEELARYKSRELNRKAALARGRETMAKRRAAGQGAVK